MNKEVKKERYSKLPVASVITGVVAIISIPFSFVIYMLCAFVFHKSAFVDSLFMALNWLFIGFPAVIGIVAVIFSAVDLSRIKVDSNNKPRIVMDIFGIIISIVAVVIGFLVYRYFTSSF